MRGFIDLATAELEAEARETDAPVELGGLDAVRLMTIHAAKGLEFGVVVVADLGRRGNLAHRDLLVSDDRVGLRLVGLDGSQRPRRSDFDAIGPSAAAADEAEERRVMHVAMTRAEERLILSGPRAWATAGPRAGPRRRADRLDRPGARAGRRRARSRASRSATTALVRTVLNAAGAATSCASRPRSRCAPGEQLALAAPRRRAAAAGRRRAGPAPATAGAPAPAPPAALSYSSLTRYAQCGYRFHLERGLGLPEEEPPSTCATPPTTADAAGPRSTCACAARSSTSCSRTSTWAPAAPCRTPTPCARSPSAHEAELTDADVADLQALVAAFAGSALRERLGAARAVHREHGFAFALGDGPMLNGLRRRHRRTRPTAPR